MRRTDPRGSSLTLLPSYMTAMKATMTRLRTTAWRMTSSGCTEPAGLRVLYYHRVSGAHDSLAVTPARFAEQMSYLADHGYAVLDLVTAYRLMLSGELPSRTVALTFDDGYQDVVDNAVPVLERLGHSATAFIVTRAADGRCAFPWYREQPPLMDWSTIVSLDGASPLCFEAHSVSHPDLRSLGEAEAKAEITRSKTELEARLGRPVTAFCYPVGLFGDRERSLVAEAGFTMAVSCEPGVNGAASDPFALRRTQVEQRDSLADFAARLCGVHDSPLPMQRAVRRYRYG